MCKKHTQTLKSDRFAPNFVWNLSEFWVFLKSVKIKVLFVSAWLLTKIQFYILPSMGEDTKTLTIFSSLTKILWSFFHKTASQGIFRCFLPLTRTLPQPPRHAPVNAKRRQEKSCRQAGSAITFPGNRKVAAARSNLPEYFSWFVRWIIHLVLFRQRSLPQCPEQDYSSQVERLDWKMKIKWWRKQWR